MPRRHTVAFRFGQPKPQGWKEEARRQPPPSENEYAQRRAFRQLCAAAGRPAGPAETDYARAKGDGCTCTPGRPCKVGCVVCIEQGCTGKRHPRGRRG